MRHFLVAFLLSAYHRGTKLIIDGMEYAVASVLIILTGIYLHNIAIENIGVIISLGALLNWLMLIIIAYNEPKVRALILSEYPKEML